MEFKLFSRQHQVTQIFCLGFPVDLIHRYLAKGQSAKENSPNRLLAEWTLIWMDKWHNKAKLFYIFYPIKTLSAKVNGRIFHLSFINNLFTKSKFLCQTQNFSRNSKSYKMQNYNKGQALRKSLKGKTFITQLRKSTDTKFAQKKILICTRITISDKKITIEKWKKNCSLRKEKHFKKRHKK